jgi:hypothetical protein
VTCANCGSITNPGVEFCGDCGTAIAEPISEPKAAVAPRSSEKLRALNQSTWKVLKAVFLNPVEGLPSAFRALPKREALEVGFIFATLFDLCVVIGLYLMLPRWAGQPGIGDILKFLIFGVVPFAAITGAGILARKVFRGTGGTIESDVFIAGISLIPTGLVLLLAGLLGISNFEVSAITAVFALTYTTLILYTACTQISEIPQARSVPAVPIIILMAVWVSKIIYAAIM